MTMAVATETTNCSKASLLFITPIALFMDHPVSTDSRAEIAEQAARLIYDEGLRDYGVAKRKAAMQLGIGSREQLPRNEQIRDALRNRIALFEQPGHTEQLHIQRMTALSLMRMMPEFEPRLTGAVLDGTANSLFPIELHLFSDPAENAEIWLINQGIAYESHDKRFIQRRDRHIDVPLCCFSYQEQAVELSIFTGRALKQPPLCPLTGRGMQRASASKLESLIQSRDPV